MTTPKVGQYLYSTCSASDYGRIVAVVENTIDILITDPNDLIGDDTEGAILEITGTATLRRIRYRMLDSPSNDPDQPWIYCETPTPGCSRCRFAFWLMDGPNGERSASAAH